MAISAYDLMFRSVRQVVQAARLTSVFEGGERFSLRVEREPWMPLVIQSWSAPDPLRGERRRVLVAHYRLEGGQASPDPELEMTDAGFPVRFRQAAFGVREYRVLWRDERTRQVMFDAGAKREIAALVRVWAKNIEQQGFVEVASQAVPRDEGGDGGRVFVLSLAGQRGGVSGAGSGKAE